MTRNLLMRVRKLERDTGNREKMTPVLVWKPAATVAEQAEEHHLGEYPEDEGLEIIILSWMD